MSKIYLEIELPACLLKALDATDFNNFETTLRNYANQWTSFSSSRRYSSKSVRRKLKFRDSKLGSLLGTYDFNNSLSKKIISIDSALVISILATGANLVDIIQAVNYLTIKARTFLFAKHESDTKNTTIYFQAADGALIEISKQMTPNEIQDIIKLITKWDEARLKVLTSNDLQKRQLKR